MDIPQFSNEINPDVIPDNEPSGEDQAQDEKPSQNLEEYGQLLLPKLISDIHVITIIGQIEGHLVMPPQNKSTKYEHIIPQLVAVEQSPEIKGLMIILNTVGGDVEAGLALAEIIASMTKPTVSLVLGGGHSIGVPVAVAADRSFISSTATMTIHPIRLTGMVVGVQQSFDYLEKMQDRVVNFITAHSQISAREFKRLMMTTGELARDVGTVLVGKGAVECGLIDDVGGLNTALAYLRERIKESETQQSGGENGQGKEARQEKGAAIGGEASAKKGEASRDLEHHTRKRHFQRRG